MTLSDAGRTYTSDEIIAAIGAALKAKDMPAAAGLIGLLATVDPGAAEAILLAVKVGGYR